MTGDYPARTGSADRRLKEKVRRSSRGIKTIIIPGQQPDIEDVRRNAECLEFHPVETLNEVRVRARAGEWAASKTARDQGSFA